MIEMTLSSRHRTRNSSPGGLRPSTLPLGHGGSPQYWLSHVDGEETFLVFFKPPRPGTEPRTLAWKAAVLTTTLGPPPQNRTEQNRTEQNRTEQNRTEQNRTEQNRIYIFIYFYNIYFIFFKSKIQQRNRHAQSETEQKQKNNKVLQTIM